MGSFVENPLVQFLVMVLAIMAGFLGVKYVVNLIPSNGGTMTAFKKVIATA